MSYISELQIDGGAILPVGSSLFGVCDTPAATPAKVVTLANFDTFIHGVTVHVKFTYGNTVGLGSSFTLAVGSTNPRVISNPGGSINWSAGAVVSFTYDGNTDSGTWIVNDSDSGVQMTIDQAYNSTGTNPISGAGVADALNDLGDAAEKGVVTSIIESGAGANKTSDDLPTTNAITAYVDSKTAGLTGAMHFVGRTTTTMTDGMTTAAITINGDSYTPNAGDVVLSGDHQEYVWTETNSVTHAGHWELLGDEGSYALKTNTDSVIKTATFTPDVPGILTTKNTSIPNVTAAGSAAVFSVSQGVLKITTGSAPTLGTEITVKEVDTWTQGTAGSFNTTQQTVVVPNPVT